jgi:GT2 family glycosyltransferase
MTALERQLVRAGRPAIVDVSTIVVSYNTKDLTKSCLESVFEMTKGVDFEVIVVDNASADGSAEMVRASFPAVTLIESERNLGFGSANNVAIRRARGKYIFLLNPDTVLLNNAIRVFFEFMEDRRNLKVGAVGAYLLDEQRRMQHSYGRFVSLRDFGLDATGLRRRFSRAVKVRLRAMLGPLLTSRLARDLRRLDQAMSFKRLPETPSMLASTQQVDYITGADLFLRESALAEVGVFDERFFLYAEEMDLQYRLRRAGYVRTVIAGPEIIHLGSQSMGQREKQRLLDSAKLEFLKKHSLLKYAAYRLAHRLKLQSSNG